MGARHLARTAGLRPEHAALLREMREYLEPIVADRRANPRDDLVSDIVTAEIDGERLSDEHVYGFLRLLLPAGAETTFRVMGSTLFALLTHPGLKGARSQRPGTARRGDRRGAPLGDLRHDGQPRDQWSRSRSQASRCPRAPLSICCTGSANHDEARYEDPEQFDPDRDAKPHIAFGTGRHQCLGMHLARLELRVGVSAVSGQAPNLRLDPDCPAAEGRGNPVPVASEPAGALRPGYPKGPVT